MQVFRITLRKYSSGLAASGASARWNSAGMRVIYTAGSRSLACLENLVHRSGEGLNESFRVVVIDVPDDLPVREVAEQELAARWYKSARCPSCRRIGDDWIRSLETPVLKVPSAIVREESNYLLLPAHPDFHRIRITAVEAFEFDRRLRRTTG